MKLSDAIRAGCQMSYKITGAVTDHYGGTCALGAALLGTGLLGVPSLGSILTEYWRDRFPILGREVPSPVDGHKRDMLYIIPALNDREGWSREAIAEWVGVIEAQVEAEECATEPLRSKESAIPGIPSHVATSPCPTGSVNSLVGAV